jgi:hypothetical protein
MNKDQVKGVGEKGSGAAGVSAGAGRLQEIHRVCRAPTAADVRRLMRCPFKRRLPRRAPMMK